MSGKRPGLFHLLTSIGVLLVVIVSLMVIPGLREMGSSSIEGESSRLQRQGDSIEVTSAPFAFPDYMWDIEIRDGETLDLRPLISSVATLAPGILTESGIRIHVGQTGSVYLFELQWDADSSDNPLALTLFDSLQRPVGYWNEVNGGATIVVPGGLYKLVLSSEGLLGESFKLSAQATRTTEPSKFETPDIISGIPTLDIQMSEAMFQSWDVQRAVLSETLKTTAGTVERSNYKRVLADLITENGRSTIQLWAAGLGDPVHFSQDTPSFTGKVVSGPLLFGMSHFKLYSIRAMCGLLDYVVSSIMYDEGIFGPHTFLVRVSLNDNSLGLYLLEERSQSQGLFAGVQRYDGQLVRGAEVWNDPPPPAGLVRLEPIGIAEEHSRAFSSRLNQRAFAKTLAFLSWFQASHATQGRDFRLYRHPYLDSPEPVIRDLNVHTERETWTGLLIHTSWWLGWHPIGRGGHFIPKVFPVDEPLTPYTTTPYSFFFGTMHPAVSQFVSIPENRELFDRDLLYVGDGAFQQRFAARMQSAFAAALPFLSKDKIPILPGGGQPYRGFDHSELSWISSQVNIVVSNQLITPRTIPVLLKRSRLLIDVDPPGIASTPGSRAFSFYNLSPFSARLRLPAYVRMADNSMVANPNDAEGWYLSPSLLFPNVIPVDINEPQEDLSPYPLTREAARRFLSLERLRFSQSDSSATLVPLVNMQVADEKFNDFMSWLESNSIVTLGSVYALPAERNLLTSELPVAGTASPQAEVSPQDELVPDVVILPLSLEQIGTKHRLSLLISNFSPTDISLDLASLRWINSQDNNDMSYSIHAIWKLGERPSLIESSQVTLGAASLRSGSYQSKLDSPMVWTGALKSLLAGSAESAMPNCILAEFDLVENGTRLIKTDASGLAQSASVDGVPRKVIVQEPYEVYLPIEKAPGISLIEGYQSLPTSATLSVSDFLSPHTADSLVDGNPQTFWHVKNPPETTRHWVRIDFGEPVTITGLAILPREGFASQLWDGDNAVFQGSNSQNNEADWVEITKLSVDKAKLSTEDWHWLQYEIPNTTAYRYYRILIDDPSFFSIAELKFQASEWARPAVELAELVEQGILEIIPSVDNSLHTVRFKDKYVVISDIVKIPPGYVLEIEPGSDLSFTQQSGILSYSPIRAVGTAQQPIILSPAAGSADWAGIAVVKASGTSEFRRVRMSQAAGGPMADAQFSGGLSFMNTSVVITDTELTDFISEDGLHLHNTRFEITGLTIENSKSDALDSDWSYGTIADSAFRQSGGDGIDLCGSWAAITNSTMEDCMDKGISIGEGSVVAISRVRLIRNNTGIAVKDQSIVSLIDSEIAENDYGLLRYIKKPIYIYPNLTLENNQFRGNQTKIYEETPTSWTRQFD